MTFIAASLLRQWTWLGATLRLRELADEQAVIEHAFPELRRRRRAVQQRVGLVRGPLSAEARARLSAGMRRYWAERKAKEQAAVSRT